MAEVVPYDREAAAKAKATWWSTDPTEHQQRNYELLGDVYVYETNDSVGLWILYRKVGYAIYDIPDEESKCENGHTGYNKERFKTIKGVVDVIIDVNKKKETEKDQLHMAIVFVYVENKKQMLRYPVFRILLTEATWKFVDTNGRVYSSWNDFLIANELPEGLFCWPRNGIYSADSEGNVELGWGITPAAEPEKKIVAALDKVSGPAAFGATAVCLVGALTPLGPIVGFASGCAFASSVYSTLRGAGTLVDRVIHGQTVNPLSDRQVAAKWLSVVGSVVGMSAGSLSSKAANLAKNGGVMSKTGQITCNTLNVASLVVNGTSVGFGAFCLRERAKEGEVTPLEVLQFGASLLFFAHATVNFQTASQIIQENQKGVIENFEKSLRSNRHRKAFKKLAKNTAKTGENVMDGNAKVIRGIRSIGDKDDFFAGVVRTSKDMGGHKAVFSENGNIVVNGGVEIHPMKLYELGTQQRREFLSLTKQVSKGTISDAAFKTRFEAVLRSNTANSTGRSTSQNSDAKEAVNVMTSQLQQEIQGITIGADECRLLMLVVNELTVRVCANSENKLAKWWHLIWYHVKKLVKEMCVTYDEALQIAKQFDNFINQQNFNLANGIKLTNVFMQFACNVYERYSDHIEELKNDIKNLMTKDKTCPVCKKPCDL